MSWSVELLSAGVGDVVLRLLRVDIEQFRSIDDQWIPAEGLVVLFGANSAGKTSVLEAVEHVITQAGALRADPGADNDPFVMGSVWFQLPAVGAAGSEDARLYGSLLRGEHSKPGLFGGTQYPWDWLDDAARGPLADADLDEVISILADALAATGDAGSAEDRQLLARSVFDPGAVYFAADLTNVSLNVRGASLPPDARKAATRIAAKAGEDRLWKLAHDLVAEGWAHVAWAASGFFSWEEFAASFPPVIALDGDIESLSAELERAVASVHDLLWDYPLEVVSSDPELGEGETSVGEPYQIGNPSPSVRYAADRWLESRSDDGRAVPPGLFDTYNQGDWYRIRHSVLAAAEVIAKEANRRAPGFVQDQGTIGIEVLPVSVWGSGRHRVRATFTPFGDDTRDLKVVGAGTARWAAAAIRLAARRLGKGQQVVTDDNGSCAESEDERRRIVTHAYQEPLGQRAVRLEPSDAPAVYIADEPEAHLHPAALRSVTAWLSDLSRTAAMVLVATHSTALLDSPAALIHRVSVEQAGHGTLLRLMTGSLAEELSRVSGTLGITRGELLLLTRLALFVEGPQDEIILNEWFGDDLRAAGIRVFRVHGVDNLPGLVTSEIVTALGIRIATLSDDTDPSRATSLEVRTTGEGAVARLLAEAQGAQVTVHIVGLEQPDILYYLDETICRQIAPSFPGWSTAVSEWASEGRHGPWKRWVKKRYGVPITPGGIRALARECRAQGKIPAEITRKIHGLIAYASIRDPSSSQASQD